MIRDMFKPKGSDLVQRRYCRALCHLLIIVQPLYHLLHLIPSLTTGIEIAQRYANELWWNLYRLSISYLHKIGLCLVLYFITPNKTTQVLLLSPLHWPRLRHRHRYHLSLSRAMQEPTRLYALEIAVVLDAQHRHQHHIQTHDSPHCLRCTDTADNWKHSLSFGH